MLVGDVVKHEVEHHEVEPIVREWNRAPVVERERQRAGATDVHHVDPMHVDLPLVGHLLALASRAER